MVSWETFHENLNSLGLDSSPSRGGLKDRVGETKALDFAIISLWDHLTKQLRNREVHEQLNYILQQFLASIKQRLDSKHLKTVTLKNINPLST